MSLHILKHKSWNVWNADNIAKVKADEAKHAAKEDKKRKRIDDIEQEKRYSLLKAKKQKINDENEKSLTKSDASLQHINFFQTEEEQAIEKKMKDQHPEIEQEKRDEERQQANYFGRGSAEVNGNPWYVQKADMSVEQEKKQKKRNDKIDPLIDVTKFLIQKEKIEKKQEKNEKLPESYYIKTADKNQKDKKKNKKNKKKKEKKKTNLQN